MTNSSFSCFRVKGKFAPLEKYCGNYAMVKVKDTYHNECTKLMKLLNIACILNFYNVLKSLELYSN